jgi:WD40 repeat protein
MHSSFLKRWFPRLAILLALSPILLVRAADEDLELEHCKVLLKRLTDRVKDPSGDRDKLRNDVLALRRRMPGTVIAQGADELLRQMPSALDHLDPRSIPELEKFPWQPKELVAVLGEHRGRHGAAVACVAFSPDGSMVVSGGASYIRVWRTTDMRLIQVASYSYPSGLAFSKDGKMLAVASSSGSMVLYDVTAAAQPLVARFTAGAGTSGVYSIAFNPDGKTVAVACYDNQIRVYDVTGKTAKEPMLVQGHENAVHSIAYSPDGKTLASGSADKTVRLWDATLEIPKEKAVLAGHPGAVTALAFTPNGALLAAGCDDGSIRLWAIPAVPRGAKDRVAFGDPKAGQIYQLNFSTTGQTLAAACADSHVRLWNVTLAKPRERAKLEGHAGAVTGVMYSPDNKLIATGSADWTCRTWDVTGAPKERFTPWSHLSHVYTCAISPDCQTLASGSLDKVLRLWDMTRPEPKTRNYIKGDSIPIYNIVYSPDGSRLAVSGNTSTIRQWESATGRPLRNLTGLPYYPATLNYTPDGKNLLSYGDKTAHLYDAQNVQEIRQFAGHTTPLLSVELSRDGKKLVTSAGAYLYGKDGKIVEINKVLQYTDTTVRVWDVEKDEDPQVIKDHKMPVYRAFFSPDGKYLYSGAGGEPGLTRREAANLTKAGTPAFAGLPPIYTSFMYTPDGTRILSMYGSSQLKLWDLTTNKPVWEGNFQEVISNLAFSSDNRHLSVALVTGVIYIIRLGPPEMKGT